MKNLSGIALNYFGNKITYRKFFEHIEKAAKAFYAMGIRKGDIVTIASMHTPETIYMIYALNKIGAVANMVYLTLSASEIIEIIKNTDSKLFIYLAIVHEKGEAVGKELPNVKNILLDVSDSMPWYLKYLYRLKNKKDTLEKAYSFKDFLSLGENVEAKEALYIKNTPAVIVYTSGTTGVPKGVVLSNDNLNAIAFVRVIVGLEKETVRGKVLEFARTHLPEHAIPKKIMLIEKMPYTQSNKIDYKKLEEKYQKENR